MAERAVENAAIAGACSAWTRRDNPRCGSCGYDLRGSPHPRCPECGGAYEPCCPDCVGNGRINRLPRHRRLLVVLAVVVLLLVPGLLIAMNAALNAVVAVVALPVILLFFAALAPAAPTPCTRCHGTGIDFFDRIWPEVSA